MRTMLNLLPASFRRQQMIRKRAVQWVSIISTVLLVGWAWHWYELREDRQLNGQLETLTREHAPTQTMLKQLMDMRQQLVELQQQETVAKELDSQRNALKLLGVISESAQKTKGRLRVTKFELSNLQGASLVGQNANAAKPPGLVIAGTTLDNPAVAELYEDLQKSGLFSHVKLSTLKERDDKKSALRDYELRCEF